VQHPIKAFVGHSFASEDDEVVRTILKILTRISEVHPSFEWEDAQHPEPKGVDAKVLKRFEGKNLLIAICTRKERVVAPTALRASRLDKDKLVGDADKFGWKASDWIIQEIGVALGRGMKVILLVEEGTRAPGELQANLERIDFVRGQAEKCFDSLLGMIAALTPKDAVPQPAVKQPASGEDEEATAPPAEDGDDEPTDEWTLKDYEMAVMSAVAMSDRKREEMLSARFLACPAAEKPAAKVSWAAWMEYCRIVFADGNLAKLAEIAKENPDNSEAANWLALAYRQFGESGASAGEFKRAADLSADPKTSIRLLGEAAVASFKAGNLEQAQIYSDVIREKGRAAGNVESEVLHAERKLATARSDDKALIGLLERSLELNPGDNESRFALAYKYSEIEMEKLAAFHYSKIPRFVRSAATWNNLGVALGHLGLPIASIAAYRESEEKGETLATSNIALKLIDAGFLPEAEKALTAALAVEKHDKNVDSGLASAKTAADSEAEKEGEILQSGKPVSDFYRAFGRAYVQPLSRDISGRWEIPNGHVDLVREGNTVTGLGVYEIKGGFLSLMSASLGDAMAGTPVRYVVEYRATIYGAALVGTVSRRQEGALPKTASLLDGDAAKPRDCLMWISDSGSEISTLEEAESAHPTFRKLKRT
jgi:tetratricopeptide (TPR) repeat protein